MRDICHRRPQSLIHRDHPIPARFGFGLAHAHITVAMRIAENEAVPSLQPHFTSPHPGAESNHEVRVKIRAVGFRHLFENARFVLGVITFPTVLPLSSRFNFGHQSDHFVPNARDNTSNSISIVRLSPPSSKRSLQLFLHSILS